MACILAPISRMKTASLAAILSVIALIPVMAAMTGPSWAETAGQDDRAVGIRDTVTAMIAENGFSGTVLIADAGKTLLQAGFGPADRTWDSPNRPDTKFMIASMTKTFTAALVLQQVDEKRLSLDDTIADHLPSYGAPYRDEVTIRQLLTHRSGIPHYIDLPGWFDGRFRAPISTGAFLDHIAALPPAFEPGTGYRYSNANYYLLGLILEKLTGQPYETLLADRILKPAGMTETGSYRAGAIVKKLSRNYVREEDGTLSQARYINPDLFHATASLYSTVGDLYRWHKALMDATLLSDAATTVMFDRTNPMGWAHGTVPADGDAPAFDFVTYNGELNGYTSMITHIPARDILIILLNNNNAGFRTLSAMTLKIAMEL